jgi:hypothetical protein
VDTPRPRSGARWSKDTAGTASRWTKPACRGVWAGLRQAAARHARPAALGPLEISVTPRPTRGGEAMDGATAGRFAALGVHRLILMPPRSLDAAGLERFVEKAARELR